MKEKRGKRKKNQVTILVLVALLAVVFLAFAFSTDWENPWPKDSSSGDLDDGFLEDDFDEDNSDDEVEDDTETDLEMTNLDGVKTQCQTACELGFVRSYCEQEIMVDFGSGEEVTTCGELPDSVGVVCDGISC